MLLSIEHSSGTNTITGSQLNIVGAAGNPCELSVTGGALTIASPITGTSQNVQKGGTGTLIFNAANTYTGGTTVAAGTLKIIGAGTNNRLPNNAQVSVASGAVFDVANVNPLPQGANAIDVTLNGGTFQMTGANNSGDHVRNITFNNGGTVKTSGTVDSFHGYNLFLNGNVTVTGTGATPATIDLANGLGISGDHTFNVADITGTGAADLLIQTGEIINESAGAITKSGPGTMTITANSPTAARPPLPAGGSCSTGWWRAGP